MNPVVHFEFPAEDRARMNKFYESAFGWKTEQLGEDMNSYVIVTTTERDKKTGFPIKSGSINGGFYQKSSDPLSQHPSVVIAVDDIKESMKKVVEAGGKVAGEPSNIPGYGLYVAVVDTEGNRVSLMQPDMKEVK